MKEKIRKNLKKYSYYILIFVIVCLLIVIGFIYSENVTNKYSNDINNMSEYLSTKTGVALGSDAFFPFDDNIERAYRSGVSYIAEPGGSIRDDVVIECCNKYGIAMAFTGMRLFHH